MKENIFIQEIFKTPIYKTSLTLDNKSIKKYCLNLSKKDKGRIISNVGGWQSDNLSGVHKPLNNLFLNLETHANIFGKQIGLIKKLFINNIWININKYKDSNKLHCHPNSIISGVYYVKTPKDCGDINFINPSSDELQIDWNKHKKAFNGYTVYNSIEWFLPSIENELYLFPSWLKHYVKPNMNKKEERISISFNLHYE